MSVSINVRDDLHVSMLNTYAELNVPNYGVDLDDIPVDMDFAQVNYARITANDTVSGMVAGLQVKHLLLTYRHVLCYAVHTWGTSVGTFGT